MSPAITAERTVPAIRFKQWLNEWDSYDFSPSEHRRKPEPHIYLFSMRAAELRKLCDVYKRERSSEGAEGIQRYRDDTRTARIQQYVHYGYPYGDLPERRRSSETLNLRKPGWLPTAIVINILTADDVRKGKRLDPNHEVKLELIGEAQATLNIPEVPPVFGDTLAPFEVIDGQHRLWAFDPLEGGEAIPDDFELPVVAYHGLDIAWQAYLFWSINVSPKKINPSHAFDLYPLLRTEDWLDQVGELSVYREARAQELTTILHENQRSPWFGRVNMLGEKGSGSVSQSAWIRALIATYFATGRGSGRYGLFQAELPAIEEPLSWSRSQQAAFLIQLWTDIRCEVINAAPTYFWTRRYGGADNPERGFTDRTSMLNQDMGVRSVLSVSNDIFFRYAIEWKLDRWNLLSGDSDGQEDVFDALDSLQDQPFRQNLQDFARALVHFDWRSYDGPEVTTDEGRVKRAYRGSGGYAALAEDILRRMAEADDHMGQVAKVMLPQSEL